MYSSLFCFNLNKNRFKLFVFETLKRFSAFPLFLTLFEVCYLNIILSLNVYSVLEKLI